MLIYKTVYQNNTSISGGSLDIIQENYIFCVVYLFLHESPGIILRLANGKFIEAIVYSKSFPFTISCHYRDDSEELVSLG